jgi:hypothetical protein
VLAVRVCEAAGVALASIPGDMASAAAAAAAAAAGTVIEVMMGAQDKHKWEIRVDGLVVTFSPAPLPGMLEQLVKHMELGAEGLLEEIVEH